MQKEQYQQDAERSRADGDGHSEAAEMSEDFSADLKQVMEQDEDEDEVNDEEDHNSDEE